MESHVLNSYHQARYRSIGHKLLHTQPKGTCTGQSNDGYTQRWDQHWSRNQTINMTRSQDTSSDEDENIEVQELTYDDRSDSIPPETAEDQILVEGDDYDVIQVYAVDPNLDLEASDDDDQDDFCVGNNIRTITINASQEDTEEYLTVLNSQRKYSESQSIEGLNFNLDTPVVSNVDEYFIKEDKDKDILAVKDEPVVNDVDEYFIKEERPRTPNLGDFFIKVKQSEELDVPKTVNIDEFFVSHTKLPETAVQTTTDQNVGTDVVENTGDVPINESDLEVLPNIEDLKRFLLEDMSYSKFKNAQRSCSLPQSPMHNLCLDVDDAKTCLSFEDLNLDLSDLSFDNDRNKSGSSNKSEDIPHTLTEEDVNSFLITDKPKIQAISFPPVINEDDLSQQDMEIEHTVESLIDPIVISKIENMIEMPESKTSIPAKSTVRTVDYSAEPTVIPKIQTPNIIPETRTFTPIKPMVLLTLESSIDPIVIPKNEKPIKIPDLKTSTPMKSTVLNFCIEKSSSKKEPIEIKPDSEELVDIESCNDTVIPVLEANNLNSLLEQFEATEKLNSKPKRVKSEESKVKSVDIKVKCADFKVKSADVKVKSVLTNGMRLQDAGVQLNKTKMRQILMPSTINASVRRSPSPVHSDHDYCSSKKRFSLPNIKGGQSLLKPEVLSSNNKILSSRHRSCKNKKVVYAISSDDESDKNKNFKLSDNSDIKLKKSSVKQTEKAIAQITRKKLSPVHSASDFKDKTNSSVIVKDACKASDTPFSQNSNGSIKLTIKNKSEVILNCDVKDSQKDKPIEKCKSSASEKTGAKKIEIQNNIKNNSVTKNIKEVDSNKKSVVSVEGSNIIIKEQPHPKLDNFYTSLFSNKQDVQIPQTIQIKSEKRSFEEEISIVTTSNKDSEQPQKKKKLNLQEYKMRRNASSNNSSAQVSPEPIFPDMPIQFSTNKIRKCTPNQTPSNGVAIVTEQKNIDAPKKIFDPIREASRKILMNTKKQKAEAMRKRDEDIVMSKIPKVENLELQPLISDAEMMKIAGMIPNETVPVPIYEKPIEKPQMPTNIEEIVMVSIGINTDDTIFKELQPMCQSDSQSPTDSTSAINFKIRKLEISKQNVFDSVKRDKKSPINEKKPHTKIDRERFKDITKTLKKVERQVDTKMYSNSLFSSIQDTVMKKAPNESSERKRSKSNSPKRKAPMIKATIIRDYDTTADHGEDKIILHLVKNRKKPQTTTNSAQTEADPKFGKLITLPVEVEVKRSKRKRNDSDMSMSSESSPIRKESPKTVERKERRTKSPSKEKRSGSKERRTRSRDRYEKYRRTRSRTRSRSRRRRRSRSRSRSRSRGRFRRYRRSDSPYRRKRRSRTRSPYRRRSPTPAPLRERLHRSKSHERSRSKNARSKTPSKRSPPRVDRKSPKSFTPPLPPRMPTISESSDSSSSSSSSSSTSSSDDSRQSSSLRHSATPRRSISPYERDGYRKKGYRSSEDRDSNTPVEERRIVFVGKLEADASKASLRAQFSKFGHVLEVRLHTKDDGSRYGFVTYAHARDAWSAVEAGPSFPHYDVGFGGRRAFCRQSYADLDGLEAKYTESAFHGIATLPVRRSDDMSFEQMLHEMRRKLQQRKGEKRSGKP